MPAPPPIPSMASPISNAGLQHPGHQAMSFQPALDRGSPASSTHAPSGGHNSNQFIWPPKYATTSTPITSQNSASSPLRSYHNVVGLPVTSTQYKSPYAVPQSSSGSSASISYGNNGRNENGYGRNEHHGQALSAPVTQNGYNVPHSALPVSK